MRYVYQNLFDWMYRCKKYSMLTTVIELWKFQTVIQWYCSIFFSERWESGVFNVFEISLLLITYIKQFRNFVLKNQNRFCSVWCISSNLRDYFCPVLNFKIYFVFWCYNTSFAWPSCFCHFSSPSVAIFDHSITWSLWVHRKTLFWYPYSKTFVAVN